MATLTYAQARELGWVHLAELMAILASNENPDGTAWTLSTSGGGGAGGSVEITDGTHTLLVNADGSLTVTQVGPTEIKDAAGHILALNADGSLTQRLADAAGHLLTINADGSLTVRQEQTTGVPTQSTDLAVAAVSVAVLAANANRKSAIIQNVGSANVRVTTDGSAATPTHGLQVVAGGSITLDQPFVGTGVINAIREGATSSSVSVLEVA